MNYQQPPLWTCCQRYTFHQFPPATGTPLDIVGKQCCTAEDKSLLWSERHHNKFRLPTRLGSFGFLRFVVRKSLKLENSEHRMPCTRQPWAPSRIMSFFSQFIIQHPVCWFYQKYSRCNQEVSKWLGFMVDFIPKFQPVELFLMIWRNWTMESLCYSRIDGLNLTWTTSRGS